MRRLLVAAVLATAALHTVAGQTFIMASSCTGSAAISSTSYTTVKLTSAALYANSMSCSLMVTSAPGTTVSLVFTSFSTERDRDYLYIWGGLTTSATYIGSYSGTASPGTVTSPSNGLLLIFQSDHDDPSTGFTASVVGECCHSHPPTPTAFML